MNFVVNIGTISLDLDPQAPDAGDQPAAEPSADLRALQTQLEQLRERVERYQRGGDAAWREFQDCYPLNPDHPVSRSWKLRLVYDDLLGYIAALEERVGQLEGGHQVGEPDREAERQLAEGTEAIRRTLRTGLGGGRRAAR